MTQQASPKVSIIVPCYNAEKHLSECLDSILKQSLHDLEVIAVNDGSTDRTLDIMEEFASRDSRVRIVSMPQNRGVQWARYEGIKAARGEWLMFADGDDFIDRDYVETMFHAAADNQVDVASASCHWVAQKRFNFFKHKGPKVAQELIGRTIDNEELMRYLPGLMHYSTIFPTVWSYIYRRSLFEHYKPPVVTSPRGEDCIFNLEVLRRVRQIHFADICGYHYLHFKYLNY